MDGLTKGELEESKAHIPDVDVYTCVLVSGTNLDFFSELPRQLSIVFHWVGCMVFENNSAKPFHHESYLALNFIFTL